MEARKLLKMVRAWLAFFMFGLVISGLTAIPLGWELGLLHRLVGSGTALSEYLPALATWVERIATGLRVTYAQYPFMAYGTDWLAFGHVVIAMVFIGPLCDPLKNRWVINFGMLACLMVIPWALIFGSIRGIPFFWQLMDMSFGIFGIIPLYFARRCVLRLIMLEADKGNDRQ